MRTKKVVCLIFLLLGVEVLLAKERFLPLVPWPREVKLHKGSFLLRPGQIRIYLAVENSEILAREVNELREALGLNPDQPSQEKTAATIWLGIPQRDGQFNKLCREKGVWPDARIGEDGYVLLIESQRILLAANTDAGVFYGLQTLKQLARGRSHPRRLPCLKIVDWPAFRYRGMQDDISRGPVPTMAFMKSQVRRCAELKLNMLSYYTEHVVATKSHGDFAPAGGALSIDDWRALSDYAKKYHVYLMGNFQSFGHFEKILSYPQYQHLGESGRLLSPAFEESYRLLEDIYAEMAPAFNAPFFNVNSDETWDLGRGASKHLVDSLGVAAVYAQHLLRLHAILRQYDKRMMMWGDIALSHPEMLAQFPKDIIVGAWHYSALDSFDFIIKPVKDAGFDVMISCGILNSRRIMPDYFMTVGNIKGFVETAARYEVLGVLNTVWDNGGSALFARDWYGVAFAAEKSWNVDSGADRDFDRRFDRAVYGDPNGKISQTIWRLAELTNLAPTQEMNEKVFWSKLVPDRGEKLKINLNSWDEVLSICEKAEAALAQTQPTRFAADLDYLRFTIGQYRFMALSRQNTVEAAESYRAACIQQKTERVQARASVLQALGAVNRSLQSLTGLRNEFAELWLRENRVYSLDRILERYDEKWQALQDVQRRLLAALANFDQGQYLPPPNEVRLDIEKVSGQYFQSWLMVGPFPCPRPDGYKVDHLASLGGERQARGQVAGQFQGLDGQTYRWQKVTSPKYAEVDLAQLYEQNTLALAYAYARIESPGEKAVRATLGSNDGIKVILNGQTIFEWHGKRNLTADENEVALPLVKGRNHLLLKIDQGKGGWGFSFRLPDAVIRNHDYKYRIIEK